VREKLSCLPIASLVPAFCFLLAEFRQKENLKKKQLLENKSVSISFSIAVSKNFSIKNRHISLFSFHFFSQINRF
jgi:hypothetical protein